MYNKFLNGEFNKSNFRCSDFNLRSTYVPFTELGMKNGMHPYLGQPVEYVS